MLKEDKYWDIIHQKIYKEHEWHSKYAEEKEKLFPRNSVVVDLGGGTGADAVYFLKSGHKVIVLDISEFALKVAQEKANQLKLSDKLVVRRVDFGLNELPLKESSVDVAYSRISLNYFPTAETIKIFQGIYRILKTGGSAYLTFKSPDDLNEMEYLKNSAAEYEPGVYIINGQLKSRFTIDEFKSMLTNSGIDNFDVHPYKEDLGTDKEGFHKEIILNEVIFKKS